MVNVTDTDSWDHRVEVLKWQVALIFVCKPFIVIDNSPQIIVRIFALLLHKSDAFIKHLNRLQYFPTNVKFVSNIFELVIV